MWKVTIKGLWAKKLRFLMTGIAVVLGVSFVAGTLVLSATIKRTFDGLVTDIYKGTDAVVRGPKLFKSDFGDIRPRIPDAVLEQVRKVDGVGVAYASVNVNQAQIVGKDGKVIGDPARGAPTFGIAWIPDESLNSYHLVEGKPPTASDAVVMDKAAADTSKHRVGDRVRILTPAGSEEFRLTGVMKFGDADNALGSTAVGFTLATAQRLNKQPGMIDGVVVKASSGVSSREVVARLRTALGTDAATKKLNVVSGASITQETQDQIGEAIDVINTFLLVFAGVALFVGAFLIFNTFSIIVGQRVREMALLRAVGAAQRQVLGSVLFEASLVGMLASASGIGVGIFLAGALKALMAAFGLDIPAGATVVQANAIIVPFLLGLVVTVVAAVMPALRAARIPPIVAMSEVAVERKGRPAWRLATGLAMLVVGLVVLFVGLFGDSDDALTLVGVGVVLTFLGVSTLGPTFARPVARLLGAPLPRLRGTIGALARENAMRNPRRTSTTAAALMVGVGLVVVLMVTVSSFKSSFFDSIDRQIRADYVVSTGSGGQTVGFSSAAEEQIAKTRGVQEVLAVRYGFAKVGDSVSQVGAIGGSTPDAESLFDPDVIEGSLEGLGTGGLAIQEDKANDKKVSIGDTLPVLYQNGKKADVTVKAIYKEGSPFGNYFISTEAFDANYPDAQDSFLLVKTVGGAAEANRVALVAALEEPYPNAKIDTRAQFKDRVSGSINQFLGFMYALLFFAILIALFGIANTLGLSILERRRELGLLRAVGMARRQLRSVIRWESVIISLFGTALGLVIGIGFGWALVVSLKDQGLSRFALPVGQIALVVALAALAGVMAAAFPARRAARLDILESIGME